MTAVAAFLQTAIAQPDLPALEIAGETWTYAELAAAAWSIAQRLPLAQPGQPQPVTALMAQRTASSYVAILATQMRGHAYVPINVKQPTQRNAIILGVSGAQRVIVGDLTSDRFNSIRLAAPDVVKSVEVISCGENLADFDGKYLEQTPADLANDWKERVAYILFTSGSTGTPKGVLVPSSSLSAYLSATQSLLPVEVGSRFSQTFDLTFDLSVHDLFVSLSRKATLVVPSEEDLRQPGRFIQNKAITHWFSVPALAFQMRLQGALEAGAFQSLKSSLFCGEILPAPLALDWANAAPNSVVENWYGPTEATIACSQYRVDPAMMPEGEAVIPIGQPFPGMEMRVLAEDLSELPKGEIGELYLLGNQLAFGYLNDPERTAAAFVTLPDGSRAYKSGDRAQVGKDGALRCLGRSDGQIKLRGYRIELGEVEAALRDASGGRNALAFAWPPNDTEVRALVAAVETEDDFDLAECRRKVETVLPAYMVPTALHAVQQFPRNSSGKADRKAVLAIIAARNDMNDRSEPLGAGAERLMAAIMEAAPALDRRLVRTAPSLFDAGMDSLAFVALTMELERSFGRTIDQDDVVRLSALSFDQLVAELAPETSVRRAGRAAGLRKVWTRLRRGFLKRFDPGFNPRANRALQFIERFPTALRTGAPPVVAVGSSGVFRGFDPSEFASVAAAQGPKIRALNIGLPAIDISGLASIAEFIGEECTKAEIRLPLAIWEFDPMHVSVSPPSGDMAFDRRFFSGKLRSRSSASLPPEFDWSPESGGSWQSETVALEPARRPNWQRERDRLIARAYSGGLSFDPLRLADWRRGLFALQKVADRVVVFIHPADQTMLSEVPAKEHGAILVDTLADIAQMQGVEVLPWQGFALDPEDFTDINHVNSILGRPKLTRQMARMIWSRNRAV
ncbi:non-ribosomal peptide synthetase [Thioclava sp. FR2]|uniref:non-ribosomal peptide synthetase n=1 Tax=Thioclava sp. FR2 TaxID=3445780 RepID=UPI003EBD434B